MLGHLLAIDFGDDYRWVAGIVFAVLALFGHLLQGKKNDPEGTRQSGKTHAESDDITVILKRHPVPPRPPRPSRPTPSTDEAPLPLPRPAYQPPEAARAGAQGEATQRPTPRSQPSAPPARQQRRPAARATPVEVVVEYEPATRPVAIARADTDFPSSDAAFATTAHEKAAHARQSAPVVRASSRSMQSILRLLGNATATRSAVVMNEILSPPICLRESHLDR